ncbi:hypothetical protein Tco_1283467 [Tanacetum coccineum]
MTSKAQQSAIDNALVAQENQRVIGKCNMRINPGMKPKEPTYQVVLDALALATCYPAFLITAKFQFFVNAEVFKDILNICLRVPGQEFDEPPTEEEALSFITKKDFHISQASGSGDGTDFESGVPDEQQRKLFGTDERIGVKPGVPDVPKYDSESNKESCGDSVEEDDDDEDDTEDDEGNDDDRDKNPNLNQFNEEHEEEEEKEENVDEFTNKEDDVNNAKDDNEEELDDGEELYKDVNVNLRKEDVEINDANQSGADQHNVSQESRFEQEEEDAHSYFTEKLLNFKNFSLADNEIASLMDTTIRNEEPSSQTSTLFTIPITVFPTTIPPPPHFFNPLPQQTTPTPTPTASEVTTAFPALVFRFNDRVTNLERDLSEMKQVDRYAQAISSILAIVDCHMDNKLGEAIHKAIQSHNAECKEEAQAEKQEYIDLVDSSVKTIIREETKRRKSSKDAESSRDPKSKESKSTSSSKGTSRSHHKSSGKSAHAEEPSHTVDDSGVQKNQEFDMGNNDEQPEDKAAPKNDCVTARAEKPPTSFDELTDTPIDFSAFVMNQLNITNLTQELLVGPAFNLLKGTYKSLTELEYHFEECSKATTERLDLHNPEGKPYPFDLHKPLSLIQDYRGRQVIPQDYFINNDLEYLKGGSLSRKYSTSVTKTKAATYEIKWIEDLLPNLWSPVKVVYDKHAYWGTSHWVTRLKIMKKYDYGHLDEIEVCREDQQLYTFKEDEHYDLNVALRMFTKRIVIQRRVEDLQLGVESYQKKINLTKPDTFISNLRNKTAYTAYSDPHRVIYKDQNNKNRLMRADELYKFSDGTLNDVQTALHDVASGIRMEYLPKRKWSGLDKRRAHVMLQDINKQLFQRRLTRNLEKFIGGREYGNDLRLLERTI